MYVIYLNCELYGVTASKEKAWETLFDYLVENGISEDFIETAKSDFDTCGDYCDGDNWIAFTSNIF